MSNRSRSNQPKLTKLQHRILRVLAGENLAAQVHPGERGGLDTEALAERMGVTTEQINTAMKGLEDLEFVAFHPDESDEPDDDPSRAPRNWTRLFQLLSKMRAEYPYATCRQAPDHDTHLIVGNLDMGLVVMFLALGITRVGDHEFTFVPPSSDDNAQACALYAEIGIRSYAAARSLRGEIDPGIARIAQDEIGDLLTQAIALQSDASVDKALALVDDSQPFPLFWAELGYKSFEDWRSWQQDNNDGS
jgi:hypothetical protein